MYSLASTCFKSSELYIFHVTLPLVLLFFEPFLKLLILFIKKQVFLILNEVTRFSLSSILLLITKLLL